MKLHQLISNDSLNRRRKIVGRGRANGRGKTCGRGHKGARARSGYSIAPGFEGGQMPLFRKLPHRGFNNKNFRQEYQTVNVSQLEALNVDGVIGAAELASAGLIDKADKPVKILGNGELTKAVKIKADKFTAGAKSKIEAAGGTIETE